MEIHRTRHVAAHQRQVMQPLIFASFPRHCLSRDRYAAWRDEGVGLWEDPSLFALEDYTAVRQLMVSFDSGQR